MTNDEKLVFSVVSVIDILPYESNSHDIHDCIPSAEVKKKTIALSTKKKEKLFDLLDRLIIIANNKNASANKALIPVQNMIVISANTL